MKREDLTRIVKSELKHLPRGDIGSPQNELRKLYNVRRRHDIATDKTRRETLRFCIQNIRDKHPAFVPEYDQHFFGRIEETPKRGLFQRFGEWRKHAKEAKSANELLKVIVEERRKSSFLESQLKIQMERCSRLEKELEITKQALVEKKRNLEGFNDRISLLQSELRTALEVCLLSHLKEHNGIIHIKDYANRLKIRETTIKETLESLEKRGKITIEQ